MYRVNFRGRKVTLSFPDEIKCKSFRQDVLLKIKIIIYGFKFQRWKLNTPLLKLNVSHLASLKFYVLISKVFHYIVGQISTLKSDPILRWWNAL